MTILNHINDRSRDEKPPSNGNGAAHYSTDEMRAFVLAKLPRERAREVVRHLLRGCVLCEAAARQAWMRHVPPPDPREMPWRGRLVLQSASRVIFLRVSEVAWIAAAGNYVRIHTDTKSLLWRETIGDVEGKLDPRQFVRIHRSSIVNLDRLVEVRLSRQGGYEAVVTGGRVLPVSRSGRERIRALTG